MAQNNQQATKPEDQSAANEPGGLAEWYEQDAERLNAMGDKARELGVSYGKAGPPMQLNPDGSLKQ